MIKQFLTDLHIHTCLSPCGEPEMVPTRIISRARELHLQAIGICDHNATENIPAVRNAGLKEDITVLSGIEITSQEEIHILAFFDDDVNLKKMQELVYKNLTGKNDSTAFGEQFIVDEKDYVTGYNERLLIGAASLTIENIVSAVHQFDGLAVASHVDREAFSIISQLGIIPEDIELDALELSPQHQKSPLHYEGYDFPYVTFSDAHRLQDIGRSTTCFYIERATVSELKKALLNSNGRKIE